MNRWHYQASTTASGASVSFYFGPAVRFYALSFIRLVSKIGMLFTWLFLQCVHGFCLSELADLLNQQAFPRQLEFQYSGNCPLTGIDVGSPAVPA